MTHNKFISLTISDIVRLTPDCVAISFDIPTEFQNEFTYLPGQYLTVRKEINGEDIRRSYSICSAPSENKVSIAVKQIQSGKFSTFANQALVVGDTLEVMPPMGNFVLDEAAKDYVFFAAGSGITPIISQIKYLLSRVTNSNVTLIYGNRNFGSIIFREELESLKNKFMQRLAIHHVFSKEKIGIPLMHGRIDREKCLAMSKQIFDAQRTDGFMLCGPSQMIFDVQDVLSELGVAKNKIHFELFNTDGIKKQSDPSNALSAIDEDKQSEITIQMDGDIFEFSLEYGGQNLLDAAIANGADLPYACKGGVCSTCRAKVTEGTVVMDLNYALEPDELEAGYVLLCQSHPRTPSVYVDFDQK